MQSTIAPKHRDTSESRSSILSPAGILGMVRAGWAFSRLLTATILAMLALIPLTLVGMVLDPKVITSVNGWIKPLKFEISVVIYAATFLWLLTYVQGRRRWVQIAANVTGWMLIIEMVLILMQVIRGTSSHFNAATAFDAVVFSIMGTAITVLAVMNLTLAILLMRQPMEDRAFAWGLRLGVLASFVGMLVAFFMTAGPTPEQLAALQAGEAVTTIGAHSVGVPDGGPGLPLVGWSTVGGDLRVPHFVGLHGLQVIPLLGWWIARRHNGWSQSRRAVLVWIGGLGYIGFTLLLTWQALRGQPVIAPDGLTLAALGMLIGMTFLASLTVILTPTRADTASVTHTA